MCSIVLSDGTKSNDCAYAESCISFENTHLRQAYQFRRSLNNKHESVSFLRTSRNWIISPLTELQVSRFMRIIGHPVNFPNDGLPRPLTFPSLCVLINSLFVLFVLFVLVTKYYSGDQIKEQETSEECGTAGGDKKHLQDFSRNT
jgi:hypothetical protein